MTEDTWLAEQFEQHRAHLRAVAGRVLGTEGDADDAVQEAWLRLSRSDAATIDNLGGWLTTVVSRVCLDMLRSRTTRREDPLGVEQRPVDDVGGGPEEEVERADAMGAALLVVLDTLRPAERLAFVLHDAFGMPFEEIAPIVDRTPAAARQLASRARRRVQGASAETDRARQREVVEAFLEATRNGEFERLLTLLDPDVVLRADQAAVAAAAASPAAPDLAALMRGGRAVAAAFSGRAAAVRPALVDGVVGATWAPGGVPRSVFRFGVRGGRITSVEVVVDPEAIAAMDIELVV